MKAMPDGDYVLPLRWSDDAGLDELTTYLTWLSRHVRVIVVDGSPAPLFARHAGAWQGIACHVRPDSDLGFANGKVNGVVTGMRRATADLVVIADDDVRYDRDGLCSLLGLLGDAELVRPQNYFDPLPWHARWDTSRTLLNRSFGADYPGTFGIRRATFAAMGGYDGDTLFENLELPPAGWRNPGLPVQCCAHGSRLGARTRRVQLARAGGPAEWRGAVRRQPGQNRRARALAAAGWSVGVASAQERGLALTSRWCAQRHVIRSLHPTDAFVALVAEVAHDHRYDVVFGASEAEVLALSAGREEIPAIFPHAPHDVVLRALDKGELARAASTVGIAVPEVIPIDAISDEGTPVIVKARMHARPDRGLPAADRYEPSRRPDRGAPPGRRDSRVRRRTGSAEVSPRTAPRLRRRPRRLRSRHRRRMCAACVPDLAP
jgi:hypothetical protein